jgi:hypothetical protein
MALTYCLLTSPVGVMVNHIGFHTCMSLGFIITSIGYVILVPPPWWGQWFNDLPGREHFAMVIAGLGAAFAYVPIYPALLRASGKESVEVGAEKQCSSRHPAC